MAHALIRMVVEVDVRDFHVARWKRFRIDAEAMVLRGDLHFLREKIFHGMVRAVVSEFQFESAPAKSQAAELMSQADAEDRDASEQFLNISDGVGNRFGIAGTVGEENAM